MTTPESGIEPCRTEKPEVRPLDAGNRGRAAQVLSDAFFDYPMFTFYFPDRDVRTRHLTWYMDKVLRCAMRYGSAWTTHDVAGVLFVLPPAHTRLSTLQYIRNGFLSAPFRFGIRNYARVLACEDFVADIHESVMAGRTHLYLWGLVVDPARQRQGIGSALMAALLKQADREGLPVYLETHDRANLDYYRRTGFRSAFEGRLAGFDIEIWGMVREPVTD